ncbi:CotH kinase family protein [Flavimarina sp. Hel_I_48]|uniref:CotH kinase family protein n=1 Tax=Flavimarina sp. Hel_I_48 TaxID=1392488 RepID=UPI0004DFAB62|nr:CotH kinase family protein [Flavimarina sp. Hel_I_48]
MKKFYTLFLFFLISINLQAQESYNLAIPVDRYQIDPTNGIIICNIDISQFPDLSSFESVVLELENTYKFISNPGKISHQTTYTVENEARTYVLYFSNIPLIAINAESIVDEPKKTATFVYADADGVKKSITGIELRGGSSQRFPKKTYDLEFWEDEAGEDNKDMQFDNLREDDDWILDALYNEPLRMRAFSSHKLWLDMHTPYYLDEEEDAKSGADVMYVDLFLNNKYNGLYMLSEQVDSKQLELKSFKDEEIRGELYKAELKKDATLFSNANAYDNTKERWDGFELKHPDEDEKIDWSKLYDFVDFTANSSKTDFDAGIADRLHIENAIDYYIFLNVVSAYDNRGKNYYIGKYNQENPYFFAPWDLDGTFGVKWDGTYQDVTEGILTNTLFSRLFGDGTTKEMKHQVYDRYVELRKGVLSNEQLLGRLSANYNTLRYNKVYERENLIWKNYPYNTAAKEYTDTWTAERLAYLDSYFEEYNLGINTPGKEQQQAIIYPVPASSTLYIKTKVLQPQPFTIYNLQGQTIESGAIQTAETSINVSLLSNGIYVLHLGNDNMKFIVQH